MLLGCERALERARSPRRRIRGAAVERVSALTFAHFREDGAKHGGVELAGRIDELMISTLRGTALKVTALFLGLATLVSGGVAFALRG